jgi:hypothetical protein
MNYRITCNGKTIACFKNEFDRDFCLAALQEHFDDCQFDAEDD